MFGSVRYHRHGGGRRIVVVPDDAAWEDDATLPHGVLHRLDGTFHYHDPAHGHRRTLIGTDLETARQHAAVAPVSGPPAQPFNQAMSDELTACLLDLTMQVAEPMRGPAYHAALRHAKQLIHSEFLVPFRDGAVEELLAFATHVEWQRHPSLGLCVPLELALSSRPLQRLTAAREVMFTRGLLHLLAPPADFCESDRPTKRAKQETECAYTRQFAEALLVDELVLHYPRQLYHAATTVDDGDASETAKSLQIVAGMLRKREAMLVKRTRDGPAHFDALPPCIKHFLAPSTTHGKLQLKYKDRLTMSAFVANVAQQMRWRPERVLMLLPPLLPGKSGADFLATIKRDARRATPPPMPTCGTIMNGGDRRFRCPYVMGTDSCARAHGRQLPHRQSNARARLTPAAMASAPLVVDVDTDSE